MLRGAEILLDSGADPNIGFPGFGASLQVLKRNKSAAEELLFCPTPRSRYQDAVSFQDERWKYWDEAIALLER